jgi:hypothetical protein
MNFLFYVHDDWWLGEGQQSVAEPLVEKAVVRDSSAAKNSSWKKEP